MKTSKGIPSWALILGLLLIANLGWMGWNWGQNADLRLAAKHFKVEALHTNDMSGIGIFEAKTEQPLWLEFSQDGKPVIENYFFNGKDVFNIILSSDRPPRYSVYFRGPGRSVTWWFNREGVSTFTDRISYDTNGVPSKQEVWYNQTWCPVDRRNEKNGIVINGQWHQLAFDTNGLWTIEAP